MHAYTGVYSYANGDEYTGDFKKDMKHGKGRFKHIDGSVYEGIFENDVLHEAQEGIRYSREEGGEVIVQSTPY